MPQFAAVEWIIVISWAITIISFGVWFHSTINLPNVLRTQLSRMMVLFTF